MAVTGSEANAYSAAGPALGYLAQIDYPLLLAVAKGADVAGDISLETLDDVVFHNEDGTPDEVLQTKHHVDRTATLTNASTDLWKTLSNWVEAATPGRLFLLTTATASPNTAASRLCATAGRDVAGALASLERTARESSNQDNQPRYARFLALTPEARRAFLDRVFVVDAAPSATEVLAELSAELHWAAPLRRRTALVERVLGWWHHRALLHLTAVATGRHERIAVSEIQGRVYAISQTLRDDDLPLDFEVIDQPTVEEASADDRIFVHQLRLIALGNQRLRQCIYDHNRAYLQRSRWQRDNLVELGELETYDARLVDEWRRHFTPLTDDAPSQDETTVQAEARERFLRLDLTALPSIRPRVTAGYVANGSLHMLADRLRVGWHPEWINRLRHLLSDVAGGQTEDVA